MKSVKFFDPQEFYKTCPDLKESDVLLLQQWLKTQPHLPELTDSEICLFLHASYFHIEKCKTRIDNFYTFKTKLPSIYKNRSVSSDEFLSSADAIVAAILPKRSSSNEIVQVIKLNDHDPAKFNFTHFMKRFNMYLELDLLMHGPVAGVRYIVDLTGGKLTHLAKVNIILMKQMFYFLHKCYPIRPTGMHVINTISFLDKVVALIKPLLETDLFIHDTTEDLFNHFSHDILPCDLGGNEKSAKAIDENYIKFLSQHQDFFDEEEVKRRTKEELRQTKSILVNDLFGVEGSFKKLDID